ncbi:MAG: peptidoglycan DD-metalloendopeptidase family protein [Bacteroidetes bacterium]|nr:peptidoglycan DD-metalloendopeptidase family protein [Bacteroidota bacterium]
MKFFHLAFILCSIQLTTFSQFTIQYLEPNAGSGILRSASTTNYPDEAEREVIKRKNRDTIDSLTALGKLALKKINQVPSFTFPLEASEDLTDFGYHGISGFVDHDSTYPNHLQDYNYGLRTYDTDYGYNHKGTDYFLWPFSWFKMNNDQVRVIAVADGVIIGKEDGHYDKYCSMNSETWNAVYVRNNDGANVWYGHLKQNSLTAKEIGDTLTQGEYIGVVGSSGSSTGPHLHLEVYDENENLIDPYFGPGNPSISESWWIDQPPYYNPQINKVATHSSFPEFPECPEEEILNLKNIFAPGDTVWFVTYYTDQGQNEQSIYTITEPDNFIWTDWSHSIDVDYYAASYWGWYFILPINAVPGDWTFTVKFQNKIYRQSFTVAYTSTDINDEVTEIHSNKLISSVYPNPFNSSTRLEYSLQANSKVTITLYNIVGENFKPLVNDYQSAGYYTKGITMSGLVSGIYFLKIIIGKEVTTHKLIYLK